jgi:sterol desaturase/sphingolipid hydroxylase (fatty acid hydroxylase superfamily)
MNDSILHNLNLTRTLLGASALIALLIWESCAPFFPFFEGHYRERRDHLIRNLAMGLLNALIAFAVFAPFLNATTNWSEIASYGVLHRIDLPLWTHACAAVLLLDLWTYWWHRANHGFSWLWRFHRVHHSDPQMDVTSARRFHPVEIILSSLLRLPLLVLLGVHLWELILYEMIMALVVDIHHANISFPTGADRVLRTIIATPAMHKIHHSVEKEETNTNYTSLFSVWDRLFRSFRMRPDLSVVKIGLHGWSEPSHQSLQGMLLTPVKSHVSRPAS